MFPEIPFYIPLVFAITTLISVYIFYKASGSQKFLVLIILWMIFQAVLSINGFFLDSSTVPPRMILLAGPPLLLIAYMMISKKGKAFTDNLNQELITWIHTVRVPVEIVLYWLFLQKLVPEVITFSGRNFDIIMGLSAPLIAWLVFFRNKFGNILIAYWNILGIILLMNVVVTAILAAPTVLQTLAFDQPNVAVFYFPFVYLPSVVVPLVLYSHLASLRRALTHRKII